MVTVLQDHQIKYSFTMECLLCSPSQPDDLVDRDRDWCQNGPNSTINRRLFSYLALGILLASIYTIITS